MLHWIQSSFNQLPLLTCWQSKFCGEEERQHSIHHPQKPKQTNKEVFSPLAWNNEFNIHARMLHTKHPISKGNLKSSTFFP